MCIKLQALLFLLALIVRAVNKPASYDSDEEFINPRQPLLNRPAPAPVTGLPVAGTIDQRPSRNDAWSTRMREKVKSLSLTLTLSNTHTHTHTHIYIDVDDSLFLFMNVIAILVLLSFLFVLLFHFHKNIETLK